MNKIIVLLYISTAVTWACYACQWSAVHMKKFKLITLLIVFALNILFAPIMIWVAIFNFQKNIDWLRRIK